MDTDMAGVEIVDLRSSPEPGEKRKASEEPGPSQDKKSKVADAGLVEFKNGKLRILQAPGKAGVPRRRTHAFEGELIDAAEAGRSMASVPEEFWDVVAMTGHEMSSTTDTMFAKHLRAELVKNSDAKAQAVLPIEAISALIPSLFQQASYGVTLADVGSSTKIPVALQGRVWEAKDDKWWGEEQRAEVVRRREEREAARKEVRTLLAGMSEDERRALVKADKGEKGDKVDKATADKPEKARANKEKAKGNEREKSPEKKKDEAMEVDDAPGVQDGRLRDSATPVPRKVREGTATTTDSGASPTKKSKLTPEEQEARRLKQEQKDAVRAAKEEKKAAKEADERAKEEKKAKQAKMFGSFFKAKTEPSSSGSAIAGPSKPKPELSDFAKTFKPFEPKKGVVVAPPNPFLASQNAAEASSSTSVSPVSLDDHLARLRQRRRHSVARPPLPAGVKCGPRYGSVSEVWRAHQEASDPRAVLDQLRDHDRFPWKTLSFDQQARPPWVGTFSKSSVVVGPRTWFKQDPQLDYSYDSGDEWAEEGEGEEVDEAPKEEEEEEDEEDEDDEFDDWLDDSEDVGGFEPDAEDASTLGSPNRLPYKPAVKKHVVPRKVVKLSPTWHGPVWETTLGEKLEGVDEFRIQLLNETPVGVDPFAYVAVDAAQAFKTTFTDTAVGTHIGVKCLISVEPVVAKAVATATRPTANGTPATAATSPRPLNESTASNRARVPKVAFPDAHLSDLLAAIEGNPRMRTDLVSFLKEMFGKIASRAAIDAKLSEVAVREGKKEGSKWFVREEAWREVGGRPQGGRAGGAS
ncbi:hypothetical protein Q5752_005479 [Cryptotrichosporon argae]